MKSLAVFLLLAASASAQSGLIPTASQLESILGDQLELEDFESFSLAGGTSTSAPNPLDASTKPEWHLLPGVTYSSQHSLGVYTGQLLGDDSNILAGVGSSTNDVTASFDTAQLAVGFYLVNITGNVAYTETITFLHGTTVLGTVDLVLPSASEQFLGWQDASGITSVRVTSNHFAMIDDVTWGVPASAPPTWTDLGSGLAGVAGVPALAGTGTLAAGSPTGISLGSAKASSPAVLFLSLSSSPVPFKGGTLVTFPLLFTASLTTDASGAIPLAFAWPAGVPSATTIFFQYAVQDAAAVAGVSLSNGLSGVTP
ncbi:MAG: hypothetical protein H6697_11720 [Myxococcales bacterium]|nr:hypothetical protein [Myxococcales bacterium]